MDMSLQQDHFGIQCYSYQPPYLPQWSGNVGLLVFKDPHRTEKLIAGIKLPMPNNMIDGNSRNWEEDNMNPGNGNIRESMSQGSLKILATNLVWETTDFLVMHSILVDL